MKPILLLALLVAGSQTLSAQTTAAAPSTPREKILINDGWRFMRYAPETAADDLIYDVRPEIKDQRDVRPADEKPTEAEKVVSNRKVLKPWILPTGNDFIKDPAKRHSRPEGNPGSDFPFVQDTFNDTSWELLDLPHDWAIKGPFYKGWDTAVGGGMGRLPSQGVAWYRRKIDIPASDAGKSVFLDVDGAMSYAMVWVNGKLAGGWPYGYASFRINLTPFLRIGESNQLAIRLDNPLESSRWYPGGGIYRNVWLVKTQPIHIAQWGTFVTTRDVSKSSATVDLEVTIDNQSETNATLSVVNEIFALDEKGHKIGPLVAKSELIESIVATGSKANIKSTVTLANPRLWGPPPTQRPHRYLAVSTVMQGEKMLDRYETKFGIRSQEFDPVKGLHINGEPIYIKGVNQHHDLGALGAAFNVRAAERQLEILQEMGCNAIRMAHNPPATELLELTDRMGLLVVNEIFDVWERKKTPLDFHLIFPDWHEQDLRALIRRDRNHPSIILWSFGNEVGEQYTGEEGAVLARRLNAIVKEEDITRPTTVSMNFSKPDMPLSAVADVINLNYQGEGIRDTPAHAHLKGIRTSPLYPAFHAKFPQKAILSSENAAAISTRGEYLFPVHEGSSAPQKDGAGSDEKNLFVSAYELYAVDFGSSADRVFAVKAQHPFVGGGFVWSGWDYLGEPTPFYLARSSYFGIIDLAGFKKDRFYLYQSHWRPDLKMAHILPHWNWPDRVGQVTPVHVFTSGDEAELFLNGQSLGRKKKGSHESRLRWDEVIYQPGELKVETYKDGKPWASNTTKTTAAPARLEATPDRPEINADGLDLSFVTLRVTDANGLTIPRAKNRIKFTIEGPGEIVATDNGDPANLESFQAPERAVFNGLCLVIVRAIPGKPGTITLKAEADALHPASLTLKSTFKTQ